MSQRDSFSAFPIRFALSLSFLPARLIRTLPIEFRPKQGWTMCCSKLCIQRRSSERKSQDARYAPHIKFIAQNSAKKKAKENTKQNN